MSLLIDPAFNVTLTPDEVAAWTESIDQELGQLHLPYVPDEVKARRSDKQEALWRSGHVPEVFYGGAVGGGKSVALLVDALRYVDVPRYAALILRKTYADLSLPGALMDVAHYWLGGTDAHWSGERHTWTFPSGATLTFGYLDHTGAEQRYKSAEFQYIGFDELTDFTEAQYRFLFTRLRRPSTGIHGYSARGVSVANVPLRMRSASNPGGAGHQWVKRRMIEQTWPRGGFRQDRAFIPARLEDNPNVDIAAYEPLLENLPPGLRARARYGDWDAEHDGTIFHRRGIIVIPAGNVPPLSQGCRVWDLAATEYDPDHAPDPDWTVGMRAGIDPDGNIIVTHVERFRRDPGAVEDLIVETAEEIDGPGVSIQLEQEPGASGKIVTNALMDRLVGYDVSAERVTGDKVTRATPAASAVNRHRVKFVEGPWLDELIDELVDFPAGAHDDQVDTLSAIVERLRVSRSGSMGTMAGQPLPTVVSG